MIGTNGWLLFSAGNTHALSGTNRQQVDYWDTQCAGDSLKVVGIERRLARETTPDVGLALA